MGLNEDAYRPFGVYIAILLHGHGGVLMQSRVAKLGHLTLYNLSHSHQCRSAQIIIQTVCSHFLHNESPHNVIDSARDKSVLLSQVNSLHSMLRYIRAGSINCNDHFPSPWYLNNPRIIQNMILTLPTELRIEVYRHIIVESITSGRPQDISGLFFSCRTTYNEMEDDIAKVKPLILATRKWQDEHPYGRYLKIESSPASILAGGAGEGNFSMPISGSRLQGSLNRASLKRCVAALQPVLHLPWSTINLSTHVDHPLNHLKSTRVMLLELFFRNDYTPAKLTWIQRCDRLTLNFRGDTEKLEWCTWDIAFAIHGQRALKAIWIQKLDDRRNGDLWKIGYDFVEGLETIKGLQWKQEVREGLLRREGIF